MPALVAEHASAVRRYFRRAVGSPSLADDLTQDVFLRVVKSAAAFEPRGRDRAWLFTIARNVLVEHVRRVGRRSEASLSVPRLSTSPEQVTATAVHEALARLADDDRDVFLLAEVAGLTYEEIGRACSLTHAAVRSRVFRARQMLRAALSPPGPIDTRTVRSLEHDDE